MKFISGAFLLLMIVCASLTAAFEAPLVARAATGTIFIRSDGTVEPPTAPIQTDGTTYTLTASVYDTSIIVERDYIVFDGANYTLLGTNIPESNGIVLEERTGVQVINVNIEFFDVGILVYLSYSNTISGNKIRNDGVGVRLHHSSNNVISGNEIISAHAGVNLLTSSNHNSISGNSMMNCSQYNAGVWSCESSDNEIVGNKIANNAWGIWSCHPSSDTTYFIRDNNITNNYYGIGGDANFSNNIISGNNVTYSEYGIRSWPSAFNNTVEENNISNNSNGIEFGSSSNNTIKANMISNNGNGIRLNSSSNNGITGNDLTGNSFGVQLVSSSNNTFYHNNFINNTEQVGDDTAELVNYWDTGSEGNHWSDYAGVDSQPDGIGDSWHEIGPDRTDHYPLMGTFSDFNATSEHQVQTVSNSSISSFQYDGTAVSYDVTGQNGTFGFCRIRIPTTLMSIDCIVSINDTEIDSALLPCSDASDTYLYFSYEHSTRNTLKERADFNKDGIVDMRDATILGKAAGSRPGDPYWNSETDLNNDGAIDNLDVTLLSSVFLQRTDIATHRITVTAKDTTSPVVSVLSPENKTYSMKDVPLTFTVNEATSWTGYSLDGQTNLTITGNTTLTDILDGSHDVVVFANDTMGNMEASNPISFSVDTTPPYGSVVIDNGDHYTNITMVTLKLTVSDDGSGIHNMRLSNDGVWDDEQWETYTPTKTWNLTTEEGNKTVYCQVEDYAGLSSTYEATVILDTTEPSVTTVTRYPISGVQPNQPVKISVSVTDSGSGIKNVTVTYFINAPPFGIESSMTLNQTSGLYESTIPGQRQGTIVEYEIVSFDNARNSRTEDNAGEHYTYVVNPFFDLDSNGRIERSDTDIAVQAYGSRSSSPNWNSIADTNGDGKVDMRDIGAIARHFEEN